MRLPVSVPSTSSVWSTMWSGYARARSKFTTSWSGMAHDFFLSGSGISPVRRGQWSSPSCWSWMVEIVWSGHRSWTALSREVAPVQERPSTWAKCAPVTRPLQDLCTNVTFCCFSESRSWFLWDTFPFLCAVPWFLKHSCLHYRWFLWWL